VLRLCRDTAATGGAPFHEFEVAFDFSKVPAREVVDLPMEALLRGPRPELLQTATFCVDAETGLLSCWLLLPDGRQYQSFDLLRYPTGNATAPEPVVTANVLNAADGQILAFTLLGVKPGFNYFYCNPFYPSGCPRRGGNRFLVLYQW